MSTRVRILAGVVIIAIVAIGGWLWATSGQESTDDAQIDAHVTPVAARVGGTVKAVVVVENQEVEAGAVLVEIDRRDFELDLERRRAELADAEAAAIAARAGVPKRRMRGPASTTKYRPRSWICRLRKRS